MPKIGKVAGINNANDVFDAQRLFNKLKGRLTEIQKRVAFLEGRIEFVKNQKSIQANYNAITGAEVATGGAFGSGSGGSSSGGGGGGEETIPIGPDEVSASSSIVNRKYGYKSPDIFCSMNVRITDSDLVQGHQETHSKYVRHFGRFTMRDDEGVTIAHLGYDMRSRDYDHVEFAGGTQLVDLYYGNKITSHPDGGYNWYNAIYEDIWYAEQERPPTGAGFFMYPTLDTQFASMPAALAQMIESNWETGSFHSPLTTIQLEMLALAKQSNWTSPSADLVDVPSTGNQGETVVNRIGNGNARTLAGYFPTSIKIRYGASLGSNVQSTDLATYWEDDVGGIHNHSQNFSSGGSVTTGWIEAGDFTTKGQPTNTELELEITDITLKG